MVRKYAAIVPGLEFQVLINRKARKVVSIFINMLTTFLFTYNLYLNKIKSPAHSFNSECTRLCGGGRWIRTIEVRDNRFTVCPLWPLGNPSIWSWRTESNPRPADYKSAALPAELHQHIYSRYFILRRASVSLNCLSIITWELSNCQHFILKILLLFLGIFWKLYFHLFRKQKATFCKRKLLFV